MRLRIIIFIAMISCFMSGLVCCNRSSKSSDEEIRRWAEQYSSSASAFIQDFVKAPDLPPEQWEASYAFIQHYNRTRDAAQNAISTLSSMSVPNEAQYVHNTTIQVLSEIVTIANDGIQDIRDANNRTLFANAVSRYNSRMRAQSDRLESVTRQASPRIKSMLQRYYPNL